MTDSPKNYRQVISNFEAKSPDVRDWLATLPELISNYEYDVSISYIFTRIEIIKHQTLYRGLIKIHKTEAELTRTMLDKDYMSRAKFLILFQTIFDRPIPADVLAPLNLAEKVRDKVAHGKSLSAREARECICHALSFLDAFNAFVEAVADFRPCSSGRGLKGATAALSKQTTRWILKGMAIGAGGDASSKG